MIKSLLFLTVLLVVRGAWGLSVPHPACPPIGHYLLPHEYDCTKFYYCEWGNKHIEARNCGVGTEFSEELQVCTWPFIANCNLPGHPTTTQEPPVTEPEPTTTQAPITQPPPTTTEEPTPEPTTTQAPITQPPPTTTEEPTPEPTTTQAPITQPPPTTTEEPTPEPTTTQAPITQPPPTTTEEPTPEPTTTQAPITEPTTTTQEPEDECPIDPGQSEEDRKCTEYCNILPWGHEDCDKYWICQGNKAVLVVCSAGLHFNPSTSSCDFACNAGCERKSVQATADHDGLNLYLPWNKIDEHTRQLIKLISK